MKSLIVNISISVFILLVPFVNAQNPSELKQVSTHLAIIGKVDANGVHLRWAPTDFSYWVTGSRNGYLLDRAVWDEDNYPLDLKKLQFANIGRFKALTLDEWEKRTGNDTTSVMAAQALYGNDETKAMKATSMAAAKDIADQQSIRHAMGMLAADLSRNAASNLGLYHYDESVEKGTKYIYRVILENTKANLGADTAYVAVSFTGLDDGVPQVVGVDILEKHGAIQVYWPKEMNRDMFTAYHVERSVDSRKFERLTPRPVTNAEGEDQPDLHEYTDYDVEIGKKYFYRVLGVTPFAETSTSGEVVEGVPSDYQGPAPAETVKVSQLPNGFQLEWTISPEMITPDFTGWIVKRSLVASGPYLPVHDGVLPSKQRTYVDTEAAPIVGNYYMIFSVDKSGNETPSFIRAAIWEDATPPAMPVNVRASIDTFGVVKILWDDNTEIDLQGYRVFVRDDENKEWYQLTNEPTPFNSYTDTIELKTLAKSIQYTVAALDFHYNVSEYAQPFTLQLPDLIAPVRPRWKEWSIENDQLVLNWYESASDDVQIQELWVKTDKSPWEKNREFPANIQAYSYPLASGIIHDFALVAKDKAGNVSDTLYLKNVKHTATVKVVGVFDVNVSDNAKEEAIELSWNYNGPANVRFQIYRKDINSDELEELGSFDGSTRKILDKGPTAFNKGFSYFIQTVLEDGINSAWSGPYQVSFKN